MVSGQSSTLIGAAVKRKEDPRLITGAGKYTGDVQLSGMTYMAGSAAHTPTPTSVG